MPLRIEVGPRDMAQNAAVVAARAGAGAEGGKKTVQTGEMLLATIQASLAELHQGLLDAATTRLTEKTFRLASYEDMKKII